MLPISQSESYSLLSPPLLPLPLSPSSLSPSSPSPSSLSPPPSPLLPLLPLLPLFLLPLISLPTCTHECSCPTHTHPNTHEPFFPSCALEIPGEHFAIAEVTFLPSPPSFPLPPPLLLSFSLSSARTSFLSSSSRCWSIRSASKNVLRVNWERGREEGRERREGGRGGREGGREEGKE